jgi:hypothetical protein
MPCGDTIKTPDQIIFRYSDGNDEIWMFIDPKVMTGGGADLNAIFINKKGKDLLNAQCVDKNPSNGEIPGITVVRVPKNYTEARPRDDAPPPPGCCYINNELVCW